MKIRNFDEIYNMIEQEIRNQTGITASFDSDAGIRAAGTAAAIEGLYEHQDYIKRQLFVQTADEPYLYIHAAEVGVPRLEGTLAGGKVLASSNIDLTIAVGSKLTDGKGHYWSVVTAVDVKAGVVAEVDVVADQVGASWNVTAASLLWVSPVAGLNGTAQVVSINGGSDIEELESWRERILTRKQLGLSRDRQADVESAMKSIAGIKHVYVYKKRRGLGSLDVAITSDTTPPSLPTPELLEQAQLLLDAEAGFWADCYVYSPTEQRLDVQAVVSGRNVNLTAVENTIAEYIASLAPAEPYQEAVLNARIMALSNVNDVTLTPDSNVMPLLNWMHTGWLCAGTITVSAST